MVQHSGLPHAWGGPLLQGKLRAMPEDFKVCERLNFTPDGAGAHALLQIRKRGANTEWVARHLAALAGVKRLAVGYAGLKDRHAEAEQWFSVDLAGKVEPDWSQLEGGEIAILNVTRHGRKLRQGAVKENAFVITLRGIHGDTHGVETRLRYIARHGVPNYFGEQRFGRDNLSRAQAMFRDEIKVRDRFKRGIYLSTARALLFNKVLARRVRDGTWNGALPGDAMILNGRNSFFICDTEENNLAERLQQGDIHPSGPLWGRGGLPCQHEAAALEYMVLADDDEWRKGLETAGLKQQRRSLRVIPGDFTWSTELPETLRLIFTLPAGSYATSVVREIAAC